MFIDHCPKITRRNKIPRDGTGQEGRGRNKTRRDEMGMNHIERFHSRDKKSNWFTEKGRCLPKTEFNSQGNALVDQYGRLSSVLENQYGCRDVT